ncbi:hypothetical protein [Mycolicibacterium fortuitum]|uniref:hypothetical protein n=1 Tax=Mycolicibacterium fortuitum TaxID=1766 RepID=UPI003AAF8B59
MNVALAGVLPAAFYKEDDIADQPQSEYLWSDLAARRQALNLSIDDVAGLLRMDLTRYRSHESGARDLRGAAAGLVDELAAMEAFVAVEAALLIDGAPAEGTVELHALADQDTFTLRYPDAHTSRDQTPYPVSLQHVAVGRAAAELSRRGHVVEVYRGERRFDLGAARLATGLGKNETAHLLGLNVKSYYAAERGARPQGEATLGDLLDLDDFITDTAGRFEITTDDDGVSTIWVTDDQAQFEKAYPEARFQRSGTPYPVRALWVAAGRRAGALAATGTPVRIGAID